MQRTGRGKTQVSSHTLQTTSNAPGSGRQIFARFESVYKLRILLSHVKTRFARKETAEFVNSGERFVLAHYVAMAVPTGMRHDDR